VRLLHRRWTDVRLRPHIQSVTAFSRSKDTPPPTTAGSVPLIVRDAAGAVVYTKALVPSLNEPTEVGTAGTWTVVLTMTNYSGTVNFRAQKL